MPQWSIFQNDSLKSTLVGHLPGTMGERQVAEILQRLVSRDLTAEDVIQSSLPLSARSRRPHLDRMGGGYPLCYGDNPSYTASKEGT